MSIIAIGPDLDKNVFAVHGIDDAGKAVLVKPAVKRGALLQTMAKLPPRLSAGRHAPVAERRGYWKAVVAIATKNARMAWAMLSKGEAFKPLA
jgi:hypothetical protein